MSVAFRTLTLLAFAGIGCAGVANSGAGSGGSAPRADMSLRAEDRVVIPAMTIVQGIAVSDRYTFIATPHALGVYDRRFAQWLPPLTKVDGWPDLAVSAMLGDPADPSAVWFGADNYVFHYRVGIDEITRAVVPDRVSPGAFFIDPSDIAGGVIVGGASGFMRVSATGFVQPYNPAMSQGRGGIGGGGRGRIVPQTMSSVYAQYTSLQNYERLLTRDNALRTWPVLSAASSPTSSEVWLGTAGGGVFKVDPVFARSEQIPFGLLGEGAGAVARGADGVWFGSLGNGINSRGGVTFTDNAMRTWRWFDGGQAAPMNAVRVTAMSPWGATLWVATDRGVFHLDGRSGESLRRWDDMAGLPSATALAIEATAEGAWVGTLRGLVFVRSGDRVSGAGRTSDVDAPVLLGSAVRGLTRRGDTLWIASESGVFVLPPGATQARRLRSGAADSRLNLAINAIATADSIVVIATGDGDVLRISTQTGDLLDAVSFVSSARVGRIYGLAMDAKTIWVAGERGVMITARDSRMQRFLATGPDLPADAFGVALTAEYAWIATREGAVRVRRLDDGMIR